MALNTALMTHRRCLGLHPHPQGPCEPMWLCWIISSPRSPRLSLYPSAYVCAVCTTTDPTTVLSFALGMVCVNFKSQGKPDLVAQTWIPSRREAEAGGLDHLWLYNKEFEASLGFMRTCLGKNKKAEELCVVCGCLWSQ